MDAVAAIEAGLEQMYAGAMEKQAQTFGGLSSTLADAMKEMDNAWGEGYNKTKKKGMQDQIAYLNGEYGAMEMEANKAMGSYVASLENEKDRLIREALQGVMDSDSYKEAMASGTEEGYAEAGRMLMEAQVRGMNEYNSSEGAILMRDMQIAMAENVRNDTAINDAYWNTAYVIGQEFTKGFSAGIDGIGNVVNSRAMAELGLSPVTSTTGTPPSKRGGDARPSAFGMRRVPFDNFPILAHAGERLLTASEARSQDRRSGGDVILQGGNYYVREEADINRIAIALADLIEMGRMAGAGG
jgi:hypothetical protein